MKSFRIFTIIRYELGELCKNKWDLAMVTIAPCFIIILFASMFASGKAEHLPIAIIDQDNSTLSRHIEKYVQANQTLKLISINQDQSNTEQLLKQTKIWGYIHIPEGAEQRLVRAKDAQISIAYNQSFFSIGNSISSAMLISTLEAIADFGSQDFLALRLPYQKVPTPHVKISTLFNPQLNYEFYLEPFVVPAVLHLLLCCCIAVSVANEFKRKTSSLWFKDNLLFQAIFAKCLGYALIFCFWLWIWMFWLIIIRGWFVAGHLSLILIAQFLLFFAYAIISCTIVITLQNLSKSFGLLAVYGGSSLSFAGVTLPLNNAPLFTQFWSNIIPYTPYAKLQTEQWAIGSPLRTSIFPLALLLGYCLFYFVLCYLLMKKRRQEYQHEK